jgi:integrase
MTLVTLRNKPLSDNRRRLYLDYYPPIPHPETGKLTRREILKALYIFEKPKSALEKMHNKETESLAQAIRAQRQLDLQTHEYGFLSNKKQKSDFIEYFEGLANKRKSSSYDNWVSALNHLEKFTGGSLRFAELNGTFCNDFKDYLLQAESHRNSKNKTTLAQNSAVSYFNKFKASLRQAYKDGYLKIDLNLDIGTIKQVETQRQYLTIEEANNLINTNCSLPVLKRASIFAILTGVRFSDIEKLVWSEIQYRKGEGYSIHFIQKKTRGVEVLPISQQAYDILGKKGRLDQKIFEELDYNKIQRPLQDWVKKAGFTKKITFHSFRHTYATLQLDNGTDVYTVSKMLGHRDLKTTQIYAKIVDKTKRDTTDKIILDL